MWISFAAVVVVQKRNIFGASQLLPTDAIGFKAIGVLLTAGLPP
jgi:hypothetical protein